MASTRQARQRPDPVGPQATSGANTPTDNGRSSSASTRHGLENRTPRGDFNARHTTGKQRHQPPAVAAPQDAGLRAQHLDDLIDDRVLIDLVGILVGEVRVLLTADQPRPQLDSCHARTVVPLGQTPTYRQPTRGTG